MSDVASQIKQFNAGRDPDRLNIKLQKIRSDPFIFLRGTCHLFYESLPNHELLSKAPLAWVCGDLHLENFGSYKGDNRLAYFDINDFDEAALAPCTWDLVRFLTSIQLGARSLSVNTHEAELLGQMFLDAYSAELAAGKARWVERETADGMVFDLLDAVRNRTRSMFLNSRTEAKGKHRKIRIDGKKALAVSDEQRNLVTDFLKKFSATQDNPDFFNVIDVARRIAGTGSLGLERYIVLVEGKGSPDSNYLLDIKQAAPSSLIPYLTVAQPKWKSEAERVVTLQNRMQAICMAFLNSVQLDGSSYILRGLQPSEDRVALASWNGKLRRLEEVMTQMGHITAWAHLRSSGHSGSAIADELMDFGHRDDWRHPLMELVSECAQKVLSDWREYASAYDQGYFQ